MPVNSGKESTPRIPIADREAVAVEFKAEKQGCRCSARIVQSGLDAAFLEKGAERIPLGVRTT